MGRDMNRRSFLGLFLAMLGSPAFSSEEKPKLVEPGVKVVQEWLPLKPGPVKVRALPDSNYRIVLNNGSSVAYGKITNRTEIELIRPYSERLSSWEYVLPKGGWRCNPVEKA